MHAKLLILLTDDPFTREVAGSIPTAPTIVCHSRLLEEAFRRENQEIQFGVTREALDCSARMRSAREPLPGFGEVTPGSPAAP
jgi:hypothetical protein